LILRKGIKIVVTRCHILQLKCTKFDFGWGSAPDPAGGAYSAPPDPQLDLGVPTSKGKGKGKEDLKGKRRWGKREKGGGWKGEGKGAGVGKEGWGEGRGPPVFILQIGHCSYYTKTLQKSCS